MKLEKIHFKNLASLHGEWIIDLTDPMLQNAGIFALAGPVGSGKTTVFDAVRLALFGRTSRLSRISKSENEIMTGGTNECFAEIVFSCPSGRFLSRWYQHRAKSGQLQNAKHFLSVFHENSEEAEILTTKLEETRERIRSVTGMDFNHFSRAMILPQGQFSGFLQAGADERSPILEQITGTGIYAEISKKIFEKCRSLAQELEVLKKNSENIEVIPAEQLEELKQKICSFRRSADDSRRKYDFLSKQLMNRDFLETERSALAHLHLELPSAEHDVRNARKSLENAEKAFLDSRKNQESILPLLRRIRELDSRMKTDGNALRELDDSIAARESAKNSDLLLLEEKRTLLINYRNSFSQLAEALEKKKNDAVLSSELSGLENRCDSLCSLMNESESMRRKLLEINKSEDNERERSKKLQKEVLSAGTSLAEQKRIFGIRKNELDSMTGGSSLPEFFHRKEKLQNRKSILEQMISLIGSEKEVEARSRETKALADSASKKIESLASQLAIQKKLTAQISETLRTAEKNRLMEAKIAAYEKDRKALADGEKCPLCGSEHHPYIEHSPSLNAVDGCEKYRKELDEAEKAEDLLEKEILSKSLVHANLENELKRLSAERDRISESWKTLPRQEHTDPEQLLSQLGSELRTAGEELARLDSVTNEIELKMRDISSLEQKISEMTEACSRMRLEQKESETKLSSLHIQHEREKAELAEKNETLRKGSESFRSRLSEFGISVETSFPDALKQLRERSELFQIQANKSAELEKKIIALQTFVSAETARLENEKNAIVLQRAESAKRTAMLDQMKKTRLNEFGTKSPDEEEKRAELSVRSAESVRNEAAEAAKHAEDRCSTLRTRIEDTRQRIGRLETDLSAAGALLIPAETLKQNLEDCGKIRQEQEQRIGELETKLDQAENSRKNASEILARIEEKRKLHSKWEYLNSLIGSADGRKYRDFVQSLTLEKLIVNANEQLRRFTDRYTLISDRETGLDFNVADSWRGNEIRSSRNLSGGETFLVSLALALGLAHMAHNTVRIDTLFLDEGFGTLDEDSLQHALEQLAGLRHSGKLIGIITHAHGIEDAVPVVLRFTNEGGRSTITGPGVTKLPDAEQ